MLAMAGGVLGTVLAMWLVELASAVVHGLPRGADVEINASVLAFSLAASAAAGMLFGVAPALRAAGRRRWTRCTRAAARRRLTAAGSAPVWSWAKWRCR